MKRTFVFFCIFILSVFMLAPSSSANTGSTGHTITIDGDWGDWDLDEYIELSTANSPYTALFITWNSTFITFGLNSLILGDDAADFSFFVAIDTDLTDSSGAGADGYSRVSFNTFLPEYFYAFAGGGGWHEWADWDGSSWNWNGWRNTNTYYGWSGQTNIFSELNIPWSELGNPTNIAVYAWVTQEGQAPVLYSYPVINPTGTSPTFSTPYFFLGVDGTNTNQAPFLARNKQNEIIITEVYYSPAQGPDADYEFVEIYNDSLFDIDLTGYRLGTLTSNIPLSGTIKSNNFAVIARDLDDSFNGNNEYFLKSYPGLPGDVLLIDAGGADFGCSDTFSNIYVWYGTDFNDLVMHDCISYLNTWDSSGADGTGSSIEKILFSTPNSNDYSVSGFNDTLWDPSTPVNTFGTPGRSNSNPCNGTTTPGWTSDNANLNAVTGPDSVTLIISWDPAIDTGNETLWYGLYRDTTSGFTPGAGNMIDTCVIPVSVVDTGLTSGTTYYYRVQVFNCSNSSSLNSDEAVGQPRSSEVIPGDLAINEFAVKGSNEWIELYNNSSITFDLEGLEVGVDSTGLKGTINSGVTINAGSYVILNSTNVTNFQSLNDSGDIITLYSGINEIDSVGYGISGGAPIPPHDISCARVSDGTDTGDWAADFNLDTTPTPGSANDPPGVALGSSLIINELNITPAEGNDKIEIYNPTGATINMTGWFVSDGDSYLMIQTIPKNVAPDGVVILEETVDWAPGMDIEVNDVFYLFNSSGVRVDQIGWWGELQNNSTFQRIPDGSGPNNGFDWDSSGGCANLFNIKETLGFKNGDIVLPETINTLESDTITHLSAYLKWEAPGDNGPCAGTVQEYDLRYSTEIITEANWNDATVAGGLPVPLVKGSIQDITVTGLDSYTIYYFAIKSKDSDGNWSELSNVIQITTLTTPITGVIVDIDSGTGVQNVDVNLYLADNFMDLLNNPPNIAASLRTSATGFYSSESLTEGATYTIIFSVSQDNFSMSLYDLSANLYSKPAPGTINGRLVNPVVPILPVHYGAFNNTTPNFSWNIYTGNALTDPNLPSGNASADIYQILIWEIENNTLGSLVLNDFSNTNNYTVQASSALTDGPYAYEVVVIDLNYAGSGNNIPLAWFDYHNIFYIAISPPKVIQADLVASNQVDVQFSEIVKTETANVGGNYIVNPGNIIPINAERDSVNQEVVRLTFSGDFNPNTYTLTVYNVTDMDDLPVQLSGQNTAQFVLEEPKPEDKFCDDLSQFFAYPNPVKGTKILTFKNLTEEGVIKIYSIAGELIHTVKYSKENNGTLIINVSKLSLSSGVYLYHINDTKNGDSKKGKIAIIK
ncbi:MAG TPA: T9SS type A sorting domain-containing protein [Firmicutes bacterium]|nr:T9SS type A sorting domain-containing protein [Bacillota bacterium]